MFDLQHAHLHRLHFGFAACALALALTGCAAVGPSFVKPTPAAPDNWTSWRSGDASLRIPAEAAQALPAQWWLAFNDATLDALQRRAFDASPDLQTAAFRFAQARAQRSTVAAPDAWLRARAVPVCAVR